MADQRHRLADCFHTYTGNFPDIENALSIQQRVIQLSPDSDRAVSSRLTNLDLTALTTVQISLR